MDKIYTIITDFWLAYVSDTIPEYIDEALYWVSFACFMLAFLIIPVILFLVIKLGASLFGGKRRYD